MATTDWNPVLRGEFAKPYWRDLQQFVAAERAAPHGVPAARRGVRRAPPHAVRRHPGADPRPGPVPRPAARRTACASRCAPACAIPPSLVNIHKELRDDLGIDPAGPRQPRGVGAAGRAAAQHHAHRARRPGGVAPGQGLGDVHRRGDRAPSTPSRSTVVFILWGSYARKKKALIDTRRHTIIESPHPSPLSAHNGFFGSRPFSRANAALVAPGHDRSTGRSDGLAQRSPAAADPAPVTAGRLRARRARRLRTPPHGTQRVVARLHGSAHRLPAAAGWRPRSSVSCSRTTRACRTRSSTRSSASSLSSVPRSLNNQGQLTGSWVALVVGLLGALWGRCGRSSRCRWRSTTSGRSSTAAATTSSSVSTA